MKIAVTSQGTDLDALVDPRFGRAAYILIVDPATLELEVSDNAANVNAFKGSGIQAASMISDKGVSILLTGYCGPNAFRTLAAAKIQVASDVTGTVREAVQAYNEGKLTVAAEPNVDGHW